MSEPNAPHHAFDCSLAGINVVGGRVLTITIRKEFDYGNLSQGWAAKIIARYPDPINTLTVDMTSTGLVSSTFFAGLVQLHGYFVPRGASKPTLRKPDRRIEANLRMMHLDTLFVIESR